MKKIVGSILVVIILLSIGFLLLSNNETTLKAEDFGDVIDRSNVNEIEIIRSSDDKTIIIKEDQAEELYTEFLNAELKEAKNVDGALTEAYWITIREDGKRALGIRMDTRLVLSPYDYSGNKKNSESYVVEDDSVLETIEQLFK